MLIGCGCLCTEDSVSESASEDSAGSNAESSGSAGSSVQESGLESSSESIPFGPCVACDASNGYLPTQVTVEWSLEENDYSSYWTPHTEFGHCYEDYEGPFTATNDADTCEEVSFFGISQQIFQDTDSCCYATSVKALRSYDCNYDTEDATWPARVFCWFVKLQNGEKQVVVLILWYNRLDPANDPQTFPDWIHAGAGLWYASEPESSLNCFGTWTLNFLAPYGLFGPDETTMPGPGGNVYYDNQNDPIVNSFPETVTVAFVP